MTIGVENSGDRGVFDVLPRTRPMRMHFDLELSCSWTLITIGVGNSGDRGVLVVLPRTRPMLKNCRSRAIVLMDVDDDWC